MDLSRLTYKLPSKARNCLKNRGNYRSDKDEEEDVSSYRTTLRKGEIAGN